MRVGAADVAALNARLVAGGYDVLLADVERSTIDLAVTRAEWRSLEAAGLQVILIERARPLQEALQPAPALPAPANPETELSASAPAVPATYRNLDAILARMADIAATYPAIAQLVDITATYNTPPTSEGRHLFALKISDNVATDEDEPAVLS